MLIIITIILIRLALVLGYPLEVSEELKNVTTMDTNSTSRCPTWYLPTSSSGCICGSTLGPLIKCYGHERVKIRVAFCMSFDRASQQVLVGNCPYVNRDIQRNIFIEQSRNQSHLNEELCGWANRTGFLCSRCKEGLGVSTMTYGYTCMKCIGNLKGWILYFFLALMPVTVFFLVIMVCRIRTNSEKMNAMICIFQIMTFYMDKYPYTVRGTAGGRRGDYLLLTAVTIGSIWNLDFFRHIIPPFCISEHLSTLNIIAMEYIVAIYPLFLMFLTYIIIELHARDFKLFHILWLPFKWCLLKMPWKIDINRSIIDAFASLLQLSYSKLIFVSFNLLAYVETQNAKGEHGHPNVLYYDSEIPYLSRAHIPYFVLSVTILSLFVVFPVILLFIYPTQSFQKFLGLFPSINWLPLHAFADAFNGCYKNGTNGTKDYRFFGGFYFFIRLLFYLPAVISSYKSAVLFTVTPFFGAVLFGLLQPYKNNLYNKLNTIYWSLLLLTQILAIYNLYSFPIPFYIQLMLCIFPFVHMAGLATSELLSGCCPTYFEILKQRYTLLISSSFEGSRAASQQNVQSDNYTEMEYSYQNEPEPDRLINPENYQLLQTDSIKLPSYGTHDICYT